MRIVRKVDEIEDKFNGSLAALVREKMKTVAAPEFAESVSITTQQESTPSKTNMTKNPPFEDDSVAYSKREFSTVIWVLRGVVVLNTYSVLTKRSYHSSKWMLVVESNLFPKGPSGRFFKMHCLLHAYVCKIEGWISPHVSMQAQNHSHWFACFSHPLNTFTAADDRQVISPFRHLGPYLFRTVSETQRSKWRLLPLDWGKIGNLLEDRNHGVLLAGCSLLTTLLEAKENLAGFSWLHNTTRN